METNLTVSASDQSIAYSQECNYVISFTGIFAFVFGVFFCVTVQSCITKRKQKAKFYTDLSNVDPSVGVLAEYLDLSPQIEPNKLQLFITITRTIERLLMDRASSWEQRMCRHSAYCLMPNIADAIKAIDRRAGCHHSFWHVAEHPEDFAYEAVLQEAYGDGIYAKEFLEVTSEIENHETRYDIVVPIPALGLPYLSFYEYIAKNLAAAQKKGGLVVYYGQPEIKVAGEYLLLLALASGKNSPMYCVLWLDAINENVLNKNICAFGKKALVQSGRGESIFDEDIVFQAGMQAIQKARTVIIANANDPALLKRLNLIYSEQLTDSVERYGNNTNRLTICITGVPELWPEMNYPEQIIVQKIPFFSAYKYFKKLMPKISDDKIGILCQEAKDIIQMKLIQGALAADYRNSSLVNKDSIVDEWSKCLDENKALVTNIEPERQSLAAIFLTALSYLKKMYPRLLNTFNVLAPLSKMQVSDVWIKPVFTFMHSFCQTDIPIDLFAVTDNGLCVLTQTINQFIGDQYTRQVRELIDRGLIVVNSEGLYSLTNGLLPAYCHKMQVEKQTSFVYSYILVVIMNDKLYKILEDNWQRCETRDDVVSSVKRANRILPYCKEVGLVFESIFKQEAVINKQHPEVVYLLQCYWMRLGDIYCKVGNLKLSANSYYHAYALNEYQINKSRRQIIIEKYEEAHKKIGINADRSIRFGFSSDENGTSVNAVTAANKKAFQSNAP